MDFRINSEAFRRAVELAVDITSRKVKINSLNCWAEALTIEASKTGLTVCGLGNYAIIKIDLHPTKDGYVCDNAGITTVAAHDLADVMQSFAYPAPLNIYTEHGYLKLTSECDSKIFKAIRTNKCVTHYPRLPGRYNQVAMVNLPHFIRGMKKVRYAMGNDKFKMCYQCMLFECWQNTMRFTAGTGGRFDVLCLSDGDPIITEPDKIGIIIPKLNINNILRVFSRVTSLTIQVKYAKDDLINNACAHIVLEADNVVMAIFGLEDCQHYPNMDPVLNYPYTYQITTYADDWRRVSNAIDSARLGYEWLHRTRLTANIKQGYFDVRINSDTSFTEKIDFALGKYVVEPVKDKPYQPYIRCESKYIEEVAQKGYKDGIVVVKFEDIATYDAITDDEQKKFKPILVSYLPRPAKDGTTEKLDIFFGRVDGW